MSADFVDPGCERDLGEVGESGDDGDGSGVKRCERRGQNAALTRYLIPRVWERGRGILLRRSPLLLLLRPLLLLPLLLGCVCQGKREGCWQLLGIGGDLILRLRLESDLNKPH